MNLLEDVHLGLTPVSEHSATCSGYQYYHYGCDGQDDRVSAPFDLDCQLDYISDACFCSTE